MELYEPVEHGSRDFPIGVHESVCEAGFHLYPHCLLYTSDAADEL